MVSISYVTITARDDFPTAGRPELHLWEPTLQTLRNQTFKDFEYIVVDVFYDERSDYFKKHNYGLKIKHIPAEPNMWYKYGVVQTCEQFNKGITCAEGELIFFDADSAMLHPELMCNLWKHYKDGYFVSLGFGADLTYTKELYDSRRLDANGQHTIPVGEWQGATKNQAKESKNSWYSFLGYNGLTIMDHRYRQLFDNSTKDMSIIQPEWFYGICTVSIDALLKVNGFDTSFDGDACLNDCDLGSRLVMAGYGKLAMFRDSYNIEAYANPTWHPKMRSMHPEIKCNYALFIYNTIKRRYRANEPLLESDINYIINTICSNYCCIKDQCKSLPHRGPFFNKNEKELFDYWKKCMGSYKIDLNAERESCLSKQEGTYINV